jgi:hypothetical protein
VPCCRTCAGRSRACSSGYRLRALRAARPPTSHLISGREQRWTRSRCSTRASSAAWASRPRLSCPVPSRLAPTISPIRASRPMRRLSANMTRGLMRASASMCRKPSRPSCRLMLTPQLWRMRSCRWSTRPSASGRSVHIDPTEDGASVGFTVLDRVRAEMLHRVGLSDLLKPAARV